MFTLAFAPETRKKVLGNALHKIKDIPQVQTILQWLRSALYFAYKKTYPVSCHLGHLPPSLIRYSVFHYYCRAVVLSLESIADFRHL